MSASGSTVFSDIRVSGQPSRALRDVLAGDGCERAASQPTPQAEASCRVFAPAECGPGAAGGAAGRPGLRPRGPLTLIGWLARVPRCLTVSQEKRRYPPR